MFYISYYLFKSNVYFSCFRQWFKTATAPLCDWKKVIRFCSALCLGTKTQTHRGHSRGLSIHLRPSLSLIYNARRSYDHSIQTPPPQHLLRWLDGGDPISTALRSHKSRIMTCLRSFAVLDVALQILRCQNDMLCGIIMHCSLVVLNLFVCNSHNSIRKGKYPFIATTCIK